jgi:hypothetical protein
VVPLGIKINREVNIWSIVSTVVACGMTLITLVIWATRLESKVIAEDTAIRASIIRLEYSLSEQKVADKLVADKIEGIRDANVLRQESVIRELGALRSDIARLSAMIERRN